MTPLSEAEHAADWAELQRPAEQAGFADEEAEQELGRMKAAVIACLLTLLATAAVVGAVVS